MRNSNSNKPLPANRNRFKLRQVERPHQEDCHLVTCYRIGGAVIPIAAAASNPFDRQLLDPCSTKGVYGNICKNTRGRRRNKSHAMFCAKEKDRHLRARHRRVWTVIRAIAATGNSFSRQLLDPCCGKGSI